MCSHAEEKVKNALKVNALFASDIIEYECRGENETILVFPS